MQTTFIGVVFKEFNVLFHAEVLPELWDLRSVAYKWYKTTWNPIR